MNSVYLLHFIYMTYFYIYLRLSARGAQELYVLKLTLAYDLL